MNFGTIVAASIDHEPFHPSPIGYADIIDVNSGSFPSYNEFESFLLNKYDNEDDAGPVPVHNVACKNEIFHDMDVDMAVERVIQNVCEIQQQIHEEDIRNCAFSELVGGNREDI